MHPLDHGRLAHSSVPHAQVDTMVKHLNHHTLKEKVQSVCARCAPCIVSCHMWDSIRLAVDTAVVNDDDHVPSSTVDLALGLGLGSL